jgi:hypothetical protein
MVEFIHPPLEAAIGERVASDDAAFGDCLMRLNAFATKANGTITRRTCSFSDQWGKVVRADVALAPGGLSATVCLICWSDAGPGVKMAASVGGCCGG